MAQRGASDTHHACARDPECELLGSLQPLHFAYRYGSPCFPEIILLLKAEPALGGGVKRLGQPERHGAYSCASVEEFRKRLTRDAQCSRGSCNRQAERFKAQLAYHFAWMRRIVHLLSRPPAFSTAARSARRPGAPGCRY